ncbi:MAG: ABC transporter ATP-binding protein/permease [Erysipelotrichales bacterium]|nr:ABC transporter ATP-binding protein/permease [Erysipelotrichales bacterium]
MKIINGYKSYSLREIYGRILKYAWRSKWILLLSIVLTFAVLYLSNLLPMITGALIDDYIKNLVGHSVAERIQGLNQTIILYGIIFLIVVIMRYILNYIFTWAAMILERDIRLDALKKLNDLPVSYYDSEPDGKIVTRINNDVGGLRSLYQVFLSVVQSLINIVMVYGFLFVLDRNLALYSLGIFPFVILWITFFRKKIFKFNTAIRELSSKINAKINELVTGVPVIQVFSQEEEMMADYNDLVRKMNDQQNKLNVTSTLFGWELLLVIRRIATAGIIAYFGFRYFSYPELITVGLVFTFLQLIDRLVEPINAIFNNLNALEDSKVAANRIFAYMDEENDSNLYGGKECLSLNGDINFNNITFAYIPGINVLKNVNLNVKEGQSVGIVGHTGSGKSSLMNLLCRFYDYQEGEIMIGKDKIDEFQKRSFRQHVGIILQTPILFSGTIKSNVTMEDDSVPDERIIEVLKAIGADYIIKKYPEGLNAPINFKGDNLSVGEKQLISFARILIKDPKILILDEATANIDTETEIKIKEAMHVITAKRTTFIIAHRLSTIKACDKIIVLDKGSLIGEGSHASLYQTCAPYRDMYDAQYENQLEE